MTSLATALIDTIKESVSAEFLSVLAAFLESQGDVWSPEKMALLQAEIAKIAVGPKPKKVSVTKAKAVKTADMSTRCQGCEWKGGKIKNAWCKKDGAHTFQVDGETVKCCDKHFTEWEGTSADPHPKMGVGFAVAKGHNLRTGNRFMGFFGVSATNTARRIPVFPGEHYAMQAGVGQDALEGADKPLPSWIDKAMDLASQDPTGKNGRKIGGVYMPSGGWLGATESVKLDKGVYNLTLNCDTTPPTPPADLIEDPDQADETPDIN